MKKLKIDLKNKSASANSAFVATTAKGAATADKEENDIDLVVDYLRKGKVVVLPTDTVYGLHGDATNSRAIEKIRRIKKRGKNSPLLILVSSLEMVKRYCYLSQKQPEFLRKIWASGNKPVSVVLKSRGKLPRELTAGLDSIGVRLPKSVFLTTIIERVGVPVISTSLNISGQKPLIGVEGLDKYFKAPKPDLVVDAGKLKGSPSRLIDLRNVEDIKILRK